MQRSPMLLLLSLAMPGLLVAQPTKPDPTKALRGKSSFITYCSSCHGKEALGNGPLAKDLKVQPANLTELSKRNGGTFPFQMVEETIEQGRPIRGHGSRAMPAWGDAFEMTEQTEKAAKEKMTELAHYLWSLQE